ncbi:flagellin lysine-N-methylase [Paenibacillus humicus]|uniref:flagellin lysine-N-methylase n=1 Tax=Paenibacillus humicus TaxID=412861 RepID=UPI003D2BDD46
MKKKFEVLRPQYMNNFECIGQDCPDTCCAGWKINIDKGTYKKYRKINDKDMALKFREYIKKNDNSSSDDKYSYIKLDNGVCGFMDHGLCGVQKKYGEDLLSVTCLQYPRKINIVDKRVELSAKLSCPEVAQLALLNTEIMQFDVVEELMDTRYKLSKNLNTAEETWGRCFWPIRIFVIEILQNRTLSVPDRLIFLGMLCKRLHAVKELNNELVINEIINEYKIKMSSPNLKMQLDKLPKTTHIQIKLLKELLLSSRDEHIKYKEYTEKTIKAFLLDSADDNLSIEAFNEGNSQHFTPFVREHSYIVEHYLVNQVFEKLFLFNKGTNILDDYIQLVALYSMVRFQIHGVATYNKRMGPELAVGIIQAFSRVVEHNSLYLKSICDSLKNDNSDSWALMVVLIKE